MILLALLLSLLSTFCLFGAARKVELEKSGLLAYLDQHARLSRWASLLLLLVSTSLFITALGIAKGIIVSLIVWTSLASLLLLLVPFVNKWMNNQEAALAGKGQKN
jgi:hypothetical protein